MRARKSAGTARELQSSLFFSEKSSYVVVSSHFFVSVCDSTGRRREVGAVFSSSLFFRKREGMKLLMGLIKRGVDEKVL